MTSRFIPLLSLLLLAFPCPAATVFVDQDGPGPIHDGTSWATAFPAVQPAIDTAQSDDEVWVTAGVYVGPLAMKDHIRLYGGFIGTETELGQRNPATHPTILDGNKQDAAVIVPLTATGAVIDGFTIRNGWTYGIDCLGPETVIANNSIEDNSLDIPGYGYPNVSVIGVNVQATATGTRICGNTVRNNSVHLKVYSDYGPGHASATGIASSALDVLIERNTITGNMAVASSEPNPHYATDSGWGVAALGEGTVIRNNRIADNRGGVSAQGDRITVANNTFVRNEGNGISWDPPASIEVSTNGIFANNIAAFNVAGVSVNAATSHNCVFGNGSMNYLPSSSPHPTDLNSDPLFVDTSGDYRLREGSPCIDAGDDSVVAADERDAEGRLRIAGTHVDIGAYEYGSPIYTLLDAADVLRIAAGLTTASPADVSRLDVVQDNSGPAGLTITDATRIARWLLN